MADEAVKRIIIDLIPESKPFFEVMPEYDGERQTVILDPGLVQKVFWEIIQTARNNINEGDKTVRGRVYTKHGALRANERDFDSKKIDDIIDNNKKHRIKEIDEEGRITWRYQDKRGNTVITDEWTKEIITVYSHPYSLNFGKYITKWR